MNKRILSLMAVMFCLMISSQTLFAAKGVVTQLHPPANGTHRGVAFITGDAGREMVMPGDNVTVTASMNKAELTEGIASDSGLSKADAKRALDGFVSATSNALKKGDRISLVGFGSFSISNRAARTGRNPQTGKEIQTSQVNSDAFNSDVFFDVDRRVAKAVYPLYLSSYISNTVTAAGSAIAYAVSKGELGPSIANYQGLIGDGKIQIDLNKIEADLGLGPSIANYEGLIVSGKIEIDFDEIDPSLGLGPSMANYQGIIRDGKIQIDGDKLEISSELGPSIANYQGLIEGKIVINFNDVPLPIKLDRMTILKVSTSAQSFYADSFFDIFSYISYDELQESNPRDLLAYEAKLQELVSGSVKKFSEHIGHELSHVAQSSTGPVMSAAVVGLIDGALLMQSNFLDPDSDNDGLSDEQLKRTLKVSGLDEKSLSIALASMGKVITQALAKGDKVSLVGFGSFSISNTAKDVVQFRASRELVPNSGEGSDHAWGGNY